MSRQIESIKVEAAGRRALRAPVSKGRGDAGARLGTDGDFYRFSREHWKHLRIKNVVESPFAAVRLRTDAAKRSKRVANATALIWKILMVAQRRFRRLDAPRLLVEVSQGVTDEDGLRAPAGRNGRVAAWSHLHTS